MAVKRFVLGVGVLVILGVGVGSEDGLAVSFLDVGQGDAILLADGASQVLVDGGEGRVVLERLAEEMPVFDRRIEVVILSHPQRDHMEGLLHVLERYEVGLVVLPNYPYESDLQEAWLAMLLERGVPVKMAGVGERIQVSRWGLTILGPLSGGQAEQLVEKDINNGSVLVRADGCPGSGGRCLSVLLTGDAEAPVERLMVDMLPADILDVDVLKAGHHGSKTSNTLEFLQATSPRLVAISVGAENKFGHPSGEVLERLADLRIPVVRTDEVGTIRIWWSGEAWMIER